MIIDSYGRELYKCDPNKNIQCSKTGCKYNPNAEYPECDRTTNKAFASDEETYEVEHDYRVEEFK